MYKRKCKVFIISTSATVTRILYVKNTNILENNPFLKTNPSDKYQHLYITSDEDIKEGDWCLVIKSHKDLLKDDIFQYNGECSINHEYIKKIIATTNTSLYTEKESWFSSVKSFDDNKVKLQLPQPSQEFIEAYIKVYNEGNPITEVMIEYEIICGRCYSNTDECWSAKECSRNTDFPDIVKLKINSDNTINIKLIKDKWSREEVEQLCKLAFKYHCDNSRTTSLPDKWIEENL